MGLPTSRRSSISTPAILLWTPYCSKAPTYLSPSLGERRFKLWSTEPPPSGFDRSANFWEKMAPHFDYQSESVAVVVDDNMAQVFARDCAPAGVHDEPLVISWPTEGGETVSRVWRPWEDAGEKQHGFLRERFRIAPTMPALPFGSEQHQPFTSATISILASRRWRASRMDLTAGFWKEKRSRTTTSMGATEASSRSAAMQAEAS